MAVQAVAKNIKSSIEKSISNGMSFSVQMPLFETDGKYLSDEEVDSWLRSFMVDDLQYKTPSAKALAGMEAHWKSTHPAEPFILKKQPSEILVILIVPATTVVYLVYSVPKDMKYGVPYGTTEIYKDERRIVSYVGMSPPADSSVFKHKDQLNTNIIADLKKQGIYVDDEPDETITNYLAQYE